MKNPAWCVYGMASSSRLLKMNGLFRKRALLKRRYSAKETYNLKEPTYRSHPIVELMSLGDAEAGSLKLQVSFAGYSLFCRALLQKRPIILRSLRIVATPYLTCSEWCAHHLNEFFRVMCVSQRTWSSRETPQHRRVLSLTLVIWQAQFLGLFCRMSEFL